MRKFLTIGLLATSFVFLAESSTYAQGWVCNSKARQQYYVPNAKCTCPNCPRGGCDVGGQCGTMYCAVPAGCTSCPQQSYQQQYLVPVQAMPNYVPQQAWTVPQQEYYFGPTPWQNTRTMGMIRRGGSVGSCSSGTCR